MDLQTSEQWATLVGTAIAILTAAVAVIRYFAKSSRSKRTVDPSRPASSGAAPARKQDRRVRDTDPHHLGVHRAIQPGMRHVSNPDRKLPHYIDRDFDTELRRNISHARSKPTFSILIGGSSTGKSRSAFAALDSEVPDWRIFRPVTPGRLDEELRSRSIWHDTVIWLDELQNYLSAPRRAEISEMLIDLLQSNQRVSVVGTIWPKYYQETVRKKSHFENGREQAPAALLGLAHLIHVPNSLSPNELFSARTVSESDDALREALRHTSTEVTQALAAGPDLIAHWKFAPDSYANAVLAAAIELRILGVRAPISALLLERAAWGLLIGRDKLNARPNGGWFDDALSYATRTLKGATSALQIEADSAETKEVGYRIADYIYEQAVSNRKNEPVLPEIWEALKHAHQDPDDILRVARSARDRGAVEQSESLFVRASNAGNTQATIELASLMSSQLRLAEAERILQSAFQNNPDQSWIHFYRLLSEQKRVQEAEEILRLAIKNDVHEHIGTSWRDWPKGNIEAPFGAPQLGWTTGVHLFGPRSELAEMLIRQNRRSDAIKVWEEALVAEEPFADQELARVQRRTGHEQKADQLLKAAITRGEPAARYEMARVLSQRGENLEVEKLWRAAVSESEPRASRELAEVLMKMGHHEEAIEILKAGTVDDRQTFLYLAEHLFMLGRIEESETVLGRAVQHNVVGARSRLAVLLAAKEDPQASDDLFREAADQNEPVSWRYHVRFLVLIDRWNDAEFVLRENIEERDATAILATLLRFRNLPLESESIWRSLIRSDPEAGHSGLAGFYAGRGDFAQAETVLREATANGDKRSFERLATFLSARGEHSKVEQVWCDAVLAGVWNSREKLAKFLQHNGRINDAERVIRDAVLAGELNSGKNLVRLLLAQDRDFEALDAAEQAVSRGEDTALPLLVKVLLRLGKTEDAESAILTSPTPPYGRNLLLAQVKLKQGKNVSAEASFYEAVRKNESGALDALLANFGKAGMVNFEISEIPATEENVQTLVSNGLDSVAKAITSGLRPGDAARIAQTTASAAPDSEQLIPIELLMRWGAFSDSWMGVGKLAAHLLDSGREDEAEAVATSGVVLQEYGAWNSLARIHIRRGHLPSAREILWEALVRGERGAGSLLARLTNEPG